MFDPNRHQRHSIRLKGYDCARCGAYLVTVRAQNKECLFGEIVDGEMRPNAAGGIVSACWNAIPEHYPNVELDAFVVMPNHIHGVLVITDDVGATHAPDVRATHASPLRDAHPPAPVGMPRGPKPESIGAIIGQFKSAASKRINEMRDTPGASVWQRNYYEHIIRDERDLERIRHYVADNPGRWADDEANPMNVVGP
jgi:REP element-mobilizing transposase RayT